MNIKLPHMPYKFDSPEGRMEITVRGGAFPASGETGLQFVAAATFLQSGPLALKRVALAARADSYSGVLRILTKGFKVSPASHEKDSVEFRALTALVNAVGETDMEN
jgi:hypothetical protein